MDDLTQRLTIEQPVVIGGTNPTTEQFRSRAQEIGYVFVKFTETKGGTELGFPLNRDTSDFSAADFDNSSGTVHLEGNLMLNYDPVRCIADVNLATLKGTGRLVLEESTEAVVG